MKKALFVLSLIAVALAACAKKEETQASQSQEQVAVKIEKNVINQFEYRTTENIKVLVSEFVDVFGSECVTVHANYIYDSSKTDIFCIPAHNKKIFNHDKNEVVRQFTYEAGGTPVQVTMIRTKKNNYCTIVHANYMYDSSTANISCHF